MIAVPDLQRITSCCAAPGTQNVLPGEPPMPFAVTRDNVRLHYEEVGSGTPLVFVHEFAGDWRAWEPQMRYFARRYRCVTFSFRGYHPSDVPDDAKAYSYEHFRDDVIAVLDHLGIEKA